MIEGNSILCAEKRILEIIDSSPVPEDPIHARNTAQWVERLGRKDPLLRVAALGHDIERALEGEKVKRDKFPSYDAFKEAHAKNSARILKAILEECGFEPWEMAMICSWVSMHEKGGSPEADLLKDADSLSFFEKNLPLYSERHSEREVKERIKWGLERLSPSLIRMVNDMKYRDSHLKEMVTRLIEEKLCPNQ